MDLQDPSKKMSTSSGSIEGTVYVLDNHDPHYLRASEHEDMELLSIFNPPITGNEKHRLSPDGFSSY